MAAVGSREGSADGGRVNIPSKHLTFGCVTAIEGGGVGDGLYVGAGVGIYVGAGVGIYVGAGVGMNVGAGVGLYVGAGVGLYVGAGVIGG
jgi:hypothetical protein